MDELEIQAYVALAKARGATPGQIKAGLAKRGVDWNDTSVNPRNLARSAVQGATFDFGDEILGMLPEWMGGGEKAKQEMRSADKAFAHDHPIVSGLANVAGGFAIPGGAGSGLIKGAKTVRGVIGRGAALGAAAGGLAGLGHAEGSLKERAPHAVLPAVAGGVLGGILPGLPGSAKAAMSPEARATGRLQGAIDRSGGLSGLLARLKDFTGAGRGAEVTLADLSEPMRQATDFAANASDQAAEVVGRVARPRQASAPGRLVEDVRSKVGDPNADQIVSDLEQGTANWAKGPDGYGGLREKNPAIIPAMADRFGKMLHSPVVKDAWAQAQEVGLIGPMPPSKDISFDVMQGVVERLKTAKEKAFASGANDLAYRLKAVHEGVVSELERAVPGYKAISREYAIRKGLERAVKRGQELYHIDDTRSLADEVATFSKDELQKVREGMASEMITNLRKAATNRNEAKRLMDRSAAMEDKIKLIFGDKPTFEQFIKQAEVEAELAKLMSTLGGSQTARRLMAQAVDPAEIAVHAATGHPVAAALGAVRHALPHAVATGTAEKMAPSLMTQGSPAIEQLLKTWGMRPSLVPGWASKMLPVGAGAGVPNLFD